MLPTKRRSDLAHLMTSLSCSVHTFTRTAKCYRRHEIHQLDKTLPQHTVHGKLQEFYKKQSAVTRVQRWLMNFSFAVHTITGECSFGFLLWGYVSPALERFNKRIHRVTTRKLPYLIQLRGVPPRVISPWNMGEIRPIILSDKYRLPLPTATTPRVWAVGWVGYVDMISSLWALATDSAIQNKLSTIRLH
jgi:hypothetical protein